MLWLILLNLFSVIIVLGFGSLILTIVTIGYYRGKITERWPSVSGVVIEAKVIEIGSECT